MTCHPKAGPCSTLNGAGDAGTPLMKLPPKVMRLQWQHILIPSRGGGQEPEGGEEGSGERRWLWGRQAQPSRHVNSLLHGDLKRMKGFPGDPGGKKLTWQCKRHKRGWLDCWVEKIPWRRVGQPTPVSLPGKSHGQRSLVDCSPWGHKESDTTEVT